MIKSLIVRNIALIDELNIEFSNGLNVLSGETGAGKSILVDSMNLLLGERADRELIRSGREKAYVEAVLDIDIGAFKSFFEEQEIELDEELIISRDLSISGKNICRINGNIVTLSVLKSFMDRIIDLHGQHAHQSLLYAKNHLHFIDNYCKEKSTPLKEEILLLFAELKHTKTLLKQTGGDEQERMHNMDLLSFQIQEILEAQIFIGEEDTLKEEREKLRNAQTIAQVLSLGYEGLYLGGDEGGSALSLIQDVIHALSQIASYDENYSKAMERLQENAYALEECAHDLRAYSEQVIFDPQRQAEVEERIDKINQLKRKYGSTEQEVILYCENAQNKLEQLQNAEEQAEQFLAKIQTIKNELYEKYVALSLLRKEAAQRLSIELVKELNDLGMPNAKFEAIFAPFPEKNESIFKEDGIDEVEFYISTNAGEPLKPLSKTASGGEISRIMLAFKNISAGIDDISTMIFDEIDTGISGKMALIVSEKMASIARSRQVICVTHLPQIAAMADASFLIRKYSEHEETNTTVIRLEESEIIDEIARLAGGIETEHARKYAEELRQNAGKIKKILQNK